MYLVTPPSRVERPGNTHPLFGRMSQARGVSLLRENGIYRQVEMPSAEEITAAERVYLGGHMYRISNDEAAELTAAGYGAFVVFIPTFGNGLYGRGMYGRGLYPGGQAE